jgi:hypothetical protein
VTEFLDNNLLTLLVRAHECCEEGVNFVFQNRLVTVFSASNYNGLSTNLSAVLLIDEKGAWTDRRFDPLAYLHRDVVTFWGVVDDEMVQPVPLRTEASLTGSQPRVVSPCRPVRNMHTLPPQSATMPPGRAGISGAPSSGRIVPSGSTVGRRSDPPRSLSKGD